MIANGPERETQIENMVADIVHTTKLLGDLGPDNRYRKELAVDIVTKAVYLLDLVRV